MCLSFNTVLAVFTQIEVKFAPSWSHSVIVEKQLYDWAIALAGPVELSLAQVWQHYLDLSSKGIYVQYIVFIA